MIYGMGTAPTYEYHGTTNIDQAQHHSTAEGLLPSTTAVQPLRLYQGESWDTIWEWSIAQITPGRHPAE